MKATTTTNTIDLTSEIKLLEACSPGPTPETITMHELVDELDMFLAQLHRYTEYQYVADMIVH